MSPGKSSRINQSLWPSMSYSYLCHIYVPSVSFSLQSAFGLDPLLGEKPSSQVTVHLSSLQHIWPWFTMGDTTQFCHTLLPESQWIIMTPWKHCFDTLRIGRTQLSWHECVNFISCQFYRNSHISCNQCRPWSDAAFRNIWCGQGPYIGTTYKVTRYTVDDLVMFPQR